MKYRNARIAAAALAAVALTGTALAATSQGGPSHTVTVNPGESIQRAISQAHPGDTILVAPGVYRENLTITKSRITLRGAGAGPNGTVILPPAKPHPSICTEFGEVNGICVTGYVDPKTRKPGAPIDHVSVSGFRVTGFSRYGILLYNAIDLTVAGNQTSHNHRYGISGYDLTGVRYLGNSTHDNVGGGLQIGDSPKAGALIAGNRVYRNGRQGGIGLLLRDTSGGLVARNRISGNCAGMIVISTSASPVTGWTVRANTVRGNSLACKPPEEGGPPVSGLGIGLLGTGNTLVSGNLVAGNAPTEQTPLAGGILVASSASLGGTDPARTAVRGNTLRANGPADVVYDGSGRGIRFFANRCTTSIPGGLCG